VRRLVTKERDPEEVRDSSLEAEEQGKQQLEKVIGFAAGEARETMLDQVENEILHKSGGGLVGEIVGGLLVFLLDFAQTAVRFARRKEVQRSEHRASQKEETPGEKAEETLRSRPEG